VYALRQLDIIYCEFFSLTIFAETSRPFEGSTHLQPGRWDYKDLMEMMKVLCGVFGGFLIPAGLFLKTSRSNPWGGNEL